MPAKQTKEHINAIYTAFQENPGLESPIECFHCIDEDSQRRIIQTPLRKLSTEMIAPIVFNFMGATWGEAKDIKYFLPRIIELGSGEIFDEEGSEHWYTSGLNLLSETIQMVDKRCRWQDWSSAEKERIDAMLKHCWLRLSGEFPPNSDAWDTMDRVDSVRDFLKDLILWYKDLPQWLGDWPFPDSQLGTALGGFLLAHCKTKDLVNDCSWPDSAAEKISTWMASPQLKIKLDYLSGQNFSVAGVDHALQQALEALSAK